MSKQVKRLTKKFNKINELNRLIDEGSSSEKQAARRAKKALGIQKVGKSLPSAQGAWNPKGKRHAKA